MRAESKEGSPFPNDLKHHGDWLVPASALLLALTSVLVLAYAGVRLHDTSIALSDRALLTRQDEKIQTLEGKLLALDAMKKEVGELSELAARVSSAQKEREENRQAIGGLEVSIDRIMKNANVKPARGKKKKGLDPATAKLKAEGERQIASLKSRSEEIRREIEKSTVLMNEKLKKLSEGVVVEKEE